MLEALEELLNPRRSPIRLIDVKVNANVATDVEESNVNDTPADDIDWDF